MSEEVEQQYTLYLPKFTASQKLFPDKEAHDHMMKLDITVSPYIDHHPQEVVPEYLAGLKPVYVRYLSAHNCEHFLLSTLAKAIIPGDEDPNDWVKIAVSEEIMINAHLMKPKVQEFDPDKEPVPNRPPKPHWYDTFFEIAETYKKRSDDPYHQTCAIIVDANNNPRSSGYNGLPRGIKPTLENTSRPMKRLVMSHAEANAIDNAAYNNVPISGCRIFVTKIPCNVCARSIIQAGLTEVIVNNNEIEERKIESRKAAFAMFAGAGIKVNYYRPGRSIIPLYCVEDCEIITA